MKPVTTLLVAAAAALSIPACGGNGAAPPPMCTGNALVAAEANNYTFTSNLRLPTVNVQPRAADLTINWSGVTKDMQGNTVDTLTSIDMIELIIVNLSLAEVEEALDRDGNLPMQAIEVVPPPALFTDGVATTANLTTFEVNGYPVMQADISNYLDPAMFPPATTTYLAIAATGMEVGKGSLMIQAFKVDPSSTNTTITITNTSANLTFSANLHSAKATGITAGTAAVTLDWGMIQTNALGQPFVPTSITGQLIGHYSQDVAFLEKNFLQLETLPTALYRSSVPSGTVVNFAEMMTAGGQAFTGIDDTGTWLFGLQCGNCGIPAPWYLTVLRVCTP
jgi:hypothetical protein